jgi:hypothetical protein
MFSPRMPSFIKLPSHNRFDYKPLYYDPEKDRERRITEKRLNFDHGAAQQNSSKIRGQFRERIQWQHKRKLRAQNSSIRVLMLMGLLSLPIAYYLGYIGGYPAIVGMGLCLFIFVRKVSADT